MNAILPETLSLVKAVLVPVVTLAAVWLGWRLSLSSQRTQRRLDRLTSRCFALSQVMNVVDNVPYDLTSEQLLAKLESDEDFRNNLVYRMLRLFGLRNELFASLDRELVRFLDTRFRPLFVVRVGSYELLPGRLAQFASAVLDLRSSVQEVEDRLLAEHEKFMT